MTNLGNMQEAMGFPEDARSWYRYGFVSEVGDWDSWRLQPSAKLLKCAEDCVAFRKRRPVKLILSKGG